MFALQSEMIEGISTASFNIFFLLEIVQVLEYEGLNEVILVGHSYGGLVIGGVAEKVPERIRHLVYLDAYIPQ
ncbi:MAG: alpha/beta fold hydrolase, partial [Candidatus Eiseniibacteriota bacterium]